MNLNFLQQVARCTKLWLRTKNSIVVPHNQQEHVIWHEIRDAAFRYSNLVFHFLFLSLQVQKLNSWRVRSAHCTLNIHRLEKNLPWDVACAETRTRSKSIHVICWIQPWKRKKKKLCVPLCFLRFCC